MRQAEKKQSQRTGEKWSHRDQRKRELNGQQYGTKNRALDLAIWMLVIQRTAISEEWENRGQITTGLGERNNQQ